MRVARPRKRRLETAKSHHGSELLALPMTRERRSAAMAVRKDDQTGPSQQASFGSLVSEKKQRLEFRSALSAADAGNGVDKGTVRTSACSETSKRGRKRPTPVGRRCSQECQPRVGVNLPQGKKIERLQLQQGARRKPSKLLPCTG